LRGRNVLLNALRWLTAALWGGKVVNVNVEYLEEKPSLDAIRLINYFIAPARAEVAYQCRSDRVYRWGEVAAGEPKPLCHVGDAVCAVCGRPWAKTPDERGASHEAEHQPLDAPCLTARLAGRIANNKAMVFVVSRVELIRDAPSYEYSVRFGDAELVVRFYRHMGASTRCASEPDALVLKLRCCSGEAFVNLLGACVEKPRVDRPGEALREKVEALLDGVREAWGVEPDLAYQPSSSDAYLVPQLSVVNHGHGISIHDVAIGNTYFLVRIDGDRFGEKASEKVRYVGIGAEVELARFKAEVAALIETWTRTAVIYAGGDENMFVMGARSIRAAIELLKDVRKVFKDRVDTTISAAIVAADVKQPVYVVVDAANRGVDAAKEAGRDAVTVIYARGYGEHVERSAVKMGEADELIRLARRYQEERALQRLHYASWVKALEGYEAQQLLAEFTTLSMDVLAILDLAHDVSALLEL